MSALVGGKEHGQGLWEKMPALQEGLGRGGRALWASGREEGRCGASCSGRCVERAQAILKSLVLACFKAWPVLED